MKWIPALVLSALAGATAAIAAEVPPGAHGSPRLGKNAVLVTQLSSVTEPTTPQGTWIAYWPHVSYCVTVESATCSALSLVPEALTGGSTWAALRVGIGATITQTLVPPGESRCWQVPPGLRYFRGRVANVTDCTVSAYLALNP